jgi:hypothetical protein
MQNNELFNRKSMQKSDIFLSGPMKMLGTEVFFRDGQKPEAQEFFFRPYHRFNISSAHGAVVP